MTAPQIAIAPMLVALATAVGTLLVRPSPRLQRGVSLLGGVGYLAAVAALYRTVGVEGALVYTLSGWPPPFGIVLVADPLAAFMLALAAVVGLGAMVFSVVYIDPYGQRLVYHPLYHLMLVGVSGAFLTGDVFNLFVWFEVMLMASYVLVVFYSGPEHTRAALTYVVLNLIGSAVMLLSIGGLYATTGTLNMADMARRLADPAAYGIDPAPVVGLSALLFAVFALKAGIVPFHFWVPAAYRAAPEPVTAMLAGVLKKVGIYAIVRLYFTVFAAAPLAVDLPGIDGESPLAFYGPVMFVLAVASVLFGGAVAVSREDLDSMLAYSSISQVGFIVLPLAIAATADTPVIRELGITAALIYTLNHGIAKALLFLTDGAIYEAVGSIRFEELGGLTERTPVLAGVFFVGALSLVGIPPLVGFFGKLFVFDTAARAGAVGVVAVALIGATLTIAYFTRAWNHAFWGAPAEGPITRRPGQLAVVAALAVLVLALGVGIDPVIGAAEAAAEAAVDTDGYVEAVLGNGGAE